MAKESFKVMDKKYLNDHLETVAGRIKALEKEQETASLDRSIEITRELSNLFLKRKSLKQRIELDKPTGIMEHSISSGY
jgi:hypothetical protein